MSRTSGTFTWLENVRLELKRLNDGGIQVDTAMKLLEPATLSARQDTCDLHHLIQEMWEVYRYAVQKNDKVYADFIYNCFLEMGIWSNMDGWGFIGDTPEPIQINARMAWYESIL